MASRYRFRRHRRGKKLRKQRETWLQRWGTRIGRGILSLATVGSLSFLGVTSFRYFQHSGQLNIGEVKILGCMHVMESELLELAKVDFRSSLIRLDLQEVSRRLAGHPWVEKATVRRDFSGKALIIEVQERVPRALVLLDNLYLMDRNGEIFKKAEAGEKLDFPVLTGLTSREGVRKDPREGEFVRRAMEVLDTLEGRKVFTLKDVSEIAPGKNGGLIVYSLNGGVPIRLGPDDLAGQLNRLEKVLPDLRSRWAQVESLALDYPKKVVVKMKEAPEEKARKS